MGLKLYCSAGVSHFLLYPNGDVYNCMTYYNSKKKPIGNVLSEDFKINRDLEICKLPRCYAVCDLDWTNKWFLDGNGRVIKKIAANIINYESLSFISQRLEKQEFSYKFKSDVANIVWMPTLSCNYDCIYCGCALGNKFIYKNFPSSFPEINTKEWKYVFKERILPKFELLVIDISGGEPFLSETLVPILKMMAKKAYITITTNASVDIIGIIEKTRLKPYDKKTHRGISFYLSWHPLASKAIFETFFNKAIYLKKNGFLQGVNFVAHPKQLHLIDYYREIFDKNKIDFNILRWEGQDNEDNEGYAPKELEFVDARVTKPAPIDIVSLIYGNPHNSRLEIINLPDEYFLGPPFIFKLKINNSYLNGLIRESKYKDDLFLGCRIYYMGENGNKIKLSEPRQKLPEEIKDIDFTVDFLIDSKNLKTGNYEFKFDIVSENNFWFEDLGFKPAIINAEVMSTPYKAELWVEDSVVLPLKINSDYVFRIRIKNTGSLCWIKDERRSDDFKLGCRLIDEEGIVRSEYRVEFLSPIKPKDEFIEEMNIRIPTLARGRYELRFDIVNENKFWLEDIGSSPFILPVIIIDKES